MVADLEVQCASISGEFLAVEFTRAFRELDAEVEFRLSSARTQKDKIRWATDVL